MYFDGYLINYQNMSLPNDFQQTYLTNCKLKCMHLILFGMFKIFFIKYHWFFNLTKSKLLQKVSKHVFNRQKNEFDDVQLT